MATFPTSEPITATIDVVGDVRIIASDRDDTVVVVRPADPSKASDVRAAEETLVELTGGQLVVKTPKTWRHFTPFGGAQAVDVVIEVPTGSRVVADSALGQLSSDGELGACRLKTAMGDIRIDRTGALRAVTGFGNLAVDRVDGDAEIRTGSGEIHLGAVAGAAVVKNANGDTTIRDVAGDLRVKAANGDITVGRAQESAVTKTANGDVRIAEVRSGTVVAESAAGGLEVGVRAGTAVWLDLHTRFGHVRNELGDGPAPTEPGAKVTVRAHTSVGDILISRAPADVAEDEAGAELSVTP